MDILFAFTFATLFLAGGILAIFRNNAAIYALILACIFYAIAGLYNPIRLYGLEGLTIINPVFYFGLVLRSTVVAVLVLVMLKQLYELSKQN